ncbi:unnamed protein product, partial [Durusdinium trenchii]
VLKKLEDCLAKIETSEGFKKMLGLQPSQYLASLNERQTADLIYRDNARIKHSQSKRLELEISDKSELVPAPVSIVQPAHDLSPLSKALIDHLRRASATPVNGKKILFGGKKSWLGDMLSMLQSSFAQPPPSRKQLGAPAPDDPDGSRELGIQEFLTSVQDEPSVSPMDIGVSSVVPFERRITNRPDELGGGSLQYLLEKDLILQAVQGKYHLTNNGAALIKVGHKCSRLGPITSWIREVGAISDLSTFEMFLLLLQKGWVLVDAETKTKCQPFRMNAEKNFYITGGAMGRSYFIVLLRHEELLGEHLPKIFHMQPVAYYDAILACAAAGQRSLLSRI